MSRESRRIAGVLLVILPTVMIGGVSLLSLLVWEPAYAANQLRQDLWRAGHAHAGMLLVLSLVVFGTLTRHACQTEQNGLSGCRLPRRQSSCRWRFFCRFCRLRRESRTDSSI